MSFNFLVGPTKLQLHVEYQPVIRLNTSSLVVCAYECLLRVSQNQQDLNTPAVIEVAERTGTMPVLDALITKEVCKTLRSAPDMHVWLNLSQLTMCNLEALKVIQANIQESGLASRVTFEMTETSDGSLPLIISNLEWLKSKGLNVILDDIEDEFAKAQLLDTDLVSGCKYSRQSMISISDSAEKLEAVSNRVEWCQCNNKTVVLEGIETISELKIALDLGVDFVQGYLFWPALPYDSLPPRGSPVPLPVHCLSTPFTRLTAP